MKKVKCSDEYAVFSDAEFTELLHTGAIETSSQHPQLPPAYSFTGTVAELRALLRMQQSKADDLYWIIGFVLTLAVVVWLLL